LLDHSYLNEMIDNPSAENIAIWIWQRLKQDLPLHEIRVFETTTSFVTYRGE
jgi:6-pyruvoyltetrahydropterin/6-carboxytetrahydropterin synthase